MEIEKRILLVDDEERILTVGREICTALGYDVLTADSGKEALDIYHKEKKKINLVVLDMIMGSGMDGCQTFAQIVGSNPNKKAIIASGFSENDNVKEAQRLGAGDFIRKPYSIEELGLAVQKTLSGEGSTLGDY